MGIYEQGTSNAQSEPVMGHPMYPPVYNHVHRSYEQPIPQMSDPVPVLAVYPEALNTGEWATTLCGCCSDCDVCCQTCWCPCVSFGQIAEIVDEGQTSCVVHGTIYGLLCSVGIPCLYSFMWRQKLRRKFRLEKGCCGDFCVHCCCGLCALCQEHRELQSHGLDPSFGWEVARQHLVLPTAAPNPPGVMLR